MHKMLALLVVKQVDLCLILNVPPTDFSDIGKYLIDSAFVESMLKRVG